MSHRCSYSPAHLFLGSSWVLLGGDKRTLADSRSLSCWHLHSSLWGTSEICTTLEACDPGTISRTYAWLSGNVLSCKSPPAICPHFLSNIDFSLEKMMQFHGNIKEYPLELLKASQWLPGCKLSHSHSTWSSHIIVILVQWHANGMHQMSPSDGKVAQCLE